MAAFDRLIIYSGDASVTADFRDLFKPTIVTVTNPFLPAPHLLTVQHIEQIDFQSGSSIGSYPPSANIYGTPNRDVLIGCVFSDTLHGGLGNDFIATGNHFDFGHDQLFGDAGNDTIAGLGQDTASETVFGGSGADMFGIRDVRADRLADAFADLISGGAGNDTITGLNGADTLNGGLGNDSIDGGVDRDLVRGGTGDDRLAGGLDEDTLYGGDGNDSLLGGFGNDFLQGQAGNDTLGGHWCGARLF